MTNREVNAVRLRNCTGLGWWDAGPSMAIIRLNEDEWQTPDGLKLSRPPDVYVSASLDRILDVYDEQRAIAVSGFGASCEEADREYRE